MLEDADSRKPYEDGSSLGAQLARLVADSGVQEVYVFGSRAQEMAARFRGLSSEEAPSEEAPSSGEESDVDVGVRPRRGVRLGASQRVALALALEELLGVDRVDLVVLPEAGAFLALAVISGELLYCENPRDQAEYELYVLRRAGDLLPLERERRDAILRQGAR
jgi:uncharacterized protein